jgi:hypothetical protein
MAEKLAHAPSGGEQRAGSENPPTHCIVIPGITANKEGMHAPLGIHNAFEESYGTGNVTTFGS